MILILNANLYLITEQELRMQQTQNFQWRSIKFHMTFIWIRHNTYLHLPYYIRNFVMWNKVFDIKIRTLFIGIYYFLYFIKFIFGPPTIKVLVLSSSFTLIISSTELKTPLSIPYVSSKPI